jgi:hypothetical protein
MSDDCLDFVFTKDDLYLTNRDLCLPPEQSDPHAIFEAIYEP